MSQPFSTVRSALAGKRILLTGTTGFIAKVVLEKLLYDIPEVGKVLVLLRGNANFPDAAQRFRQQVMTSSVFDRLRGVYQDSFQTFWQDRIECVTGELTLPDLGMSPVALRALAQRVDLVINVAASVNFREALDQALAINTYSVRHLLALVESADSIPFIQVSTCYVNGFNRGAMREALVHPSRGVIPFNPAGYYEVDTVLTELECKIQQVCMQWGATSKLSDKLRELGIQQAQAYGWNDTYTFTKWLGEQVALKATYGKTLTIVRPSIVESTLRDPAPGWIEGVKVADAIILAYARRKVAFFPAKLDEVIDIVPADLVANGILLATAEAVLDPDRQRIYQVCSGAANPICLGFLIELLQAEARQHWQHYDRLFYKAPTHQFCTVSRTTFLAGLVFAKLGLSLIGKIRRLLGAVDSWPALEALQTTQTLATVFSFYTSPRYVFHNEQLMNLADRMGELDKQLFPVDARLIDWPTYLCKIHMAGLNRYALQDRHQRIDRVDEVVEKEVPISAKSLG
ncbi:fatty acyl-CoA reductase [Chitinivorax sp. B]|uniref:fatty acyl-CoA reductase n=1 Tax=Chitinivorax sp. B TaxID=2502235 RepID=UPI0010F9CA1F|nr:fatty acyl-CoA reductase [Chitinivorax sp. B]